MQTIYLTFQCCIFDKGDVLQHNAKPFKGKWNIFGAFLKTKYRHRDEKMTARDHYRQRSLIKNKKFGFVEN